MNGSPEFHALIAKLRDPTEYNRRLDELLAMHERKTMDYGVRGSDPLANCRGSERMGIPAWIGTMIRVGDKMQRIDSFIKNNELVNESLEDSFVDAAAYIVIAHVLYRETL